MKLRQALRSSVAAVTIASVAAPTGLSAQTSEAAPRGGGAQVRVAQAKDFSRIELAGRFADVKRVAAAANAAVATPPAPGQAAAKPPAPKA